MLGWWPDELLDHEDRNPSNNRWDNIRPANHPQNGSNSKMNVRNTTGYRGVRLSGRPKAPYAVGLSVNGKMINVGRFTDLEEAARAYDAAASLHHGRFAHLNFPEAA